MRRLFSKVKKIVSICVACAVCILSLTAVPMMRASAVNTAQMYKVYNAQNGSYITSYTLLANPVKDNSKVVIGTDNRVVDFSKNGVVKIVTNLGFGTGFVVDSHTIATAAHCVCSKNSENSTDYNISSGLKVLIFNQNGSIDKTITNLQQIHIPNNYANTYGFTNKFDYALITVSDDLSDYANFNLGVMLDDFINSGKPVSITGFPGIVNNSVVNTTINHNMYTGVGYVITNQRDKDRQLCVDCDSTGGNSGGPIYISTQYNNQVHYTVIGIITAENSNDNINIGTRMTTELLHFYKNNPNISY